MPHADTANLRFPLAPFLEKVLVPELTADMDATPVLELAASKAVLLVLGMAAPPVPELAASMAVVLVLVTDDMAAPPMLKRGPELAVAGM